MKGRRHAFIGELQITWLYMDTDLLQRTCTMHMIMQQGEIAGSEIALDDRFLCLILLILKVDYQVNHIPGTPGICNVGGLPRPWLLKWLRFQARIVYVKMLRLWVVMEMLYPATSKA